MNREIKFRGIRVDNGEWVYGAYFCLHHNDERTHIHHFIIPDDTSIPKDKPIGKIQVEIFGETLGQYTGIKDKNCKEICEGDLVKVKYSDSIGETHTVIIEIKNPFDYELNEVVFLNYSDELRVIANIHEKKELME